MDAVTPVSQSQRAGSVYMIRGFMGVFSTGIDTMSEKLRADGVHTEVYNQTQHASLAAEIKKRYTQSPVREPIVLVGHSYGADATVAVARELSKAGIEVDLIVTFDPVTPSKVPGNVQLAYNLYQSNRGWDALPWLRGIPLESETNEQDNIQNMNIRKDRKDLLVKGLDHFNIEKKPKIQADAIARVLVACPPREQWTQVNVGQLTPSFVSIVE